MPANVNRPTIVSKRDQTVSEKLQFYGVYSAFAKGKMPTNKQMDVALNSALQSKALAHPSARLSEEGRKMVADLVEVIQQAKLLLLSKNEGQLLQEFIWSTQTAGKSYAQERSAPGREKGPAFIEKETAEQDKQRALEGLKTLGKLIVTNGQFRKLLKDASVLARSMVGDAATNVAGRVNPSEEQLAQIDAPAAEGTWHDAPDFGEGDFKSKFKNQYKRAPWNKDNRTSTGDVIAPSVADTETMITADDSVTVSSTVSRTKQWQGKGKKYLDEKIPEQRRESTIQRLKMMVVEIQAHGDYQNAIVTLLDLADSYSSRTMDYSKTGANKAGSVYKSEGVQTAERNLKTLIERFANSTSLDDLFDSIKVIQDRSRTDPELRGWFRGLNAFLRRCLQEVGYVMREDSTREWNELQDHGNMLAKQRYRPEFKRVSHELQSFGKQFDADPQNKAFGDSVQKLCLDLGQDENGKPKFKPHLVKDLVGVIVPAFLENLSYVPLPRIEYSDHMVDLIVENLIIESDNLTPNVLELKSDNHWRWGRKRIGSNNKNKMLLAVSGIQMDLRDVSYYVRKKGGFPSLKDTGIMDIFLGGDGLSFLLEMETANRFSNKMLPDGAHYIKASNVKVNLSHLNIKLRKSSHKFLFALVKPILLRLMKPILSKVIASQIKKSVAEFDHVAYEISNEAKRAQDADKRLPLAERVKQPTYRRYAELAKQRYQASQQRKAATKEKDRLSGKQEAKVKFVMTDDDTMFPDVKLPPGTTAKATEFKRLAGQGTGWESPVFAVGRAQPSTKIPGASKIVRKSTWTGVPAGAAGVVGAGADRLQSRAGGPAAAGAGLAAGAAGAGGAAIAGRHSNQRQQQQQQPRVGSAGAGAGAPVGGVHPDDDFQLVNNSLPIDGATYGRAIDPASYQHGNTPVGGSGGYGNNVPSNIDTKSNSTQRFSNNSTMVDTPVYSSSADKMASGGGYGHRSSDVPNLSDVPGSGVHPSSTANYDKYAPQAGGLNSSSRHAGGGAGMMPGAMPVSTSATPDPYDPSNRMMGNPDNSMLGNAASHLANSAGVDGLANKAGGYGRGVAQDVGKRANDAVRGAAHGVGDGFDQMRR